ncbi:hypothetical protein YDYSY3_31660 [Paenibacillus chitinolyticus]|uniref:hypothetical protein n=1 Tax=Paenibacillus chitinolyticus TaxID=79263 RepID=UPI0026E4EA22|nr:hypothetical protein [Paenibacillus chitinolyticus]GKS12166.1 hypothetical protein YDYSY3_31660 [Paenibacillus chitinolyticus]
MYSPPYPVPYPFCPPVFVSAVHGLPAGPGPYPRLPENPGPGYPSVEPKQLISSAASFRKLLADGNVILARLSDEPFARRLMTAAQAGRKQEVDRLMKDIAISSVLTARYTPSGLIVTVTPGVQDPACCILTMSLKWGQ